MPKIPKYKTRDQLMYISNLMDLQEIADHFGVPKSRVRGWFRRRYKKFPRPLRAINGGWVFDGHEINDWWEQNRHLIRRTS